jgi:L-fuculose-phosphate aldolase
MNKNDMKKQIVDVSRMAYVKGLTAGTGGNVSWRLDEESILITPHKCSLGFLNEDDIITVATNGEIIVGSINSRVSTEINMHLALYNEFDYKAIIHLHPPYINTLVAKDITMKLSTYESSLTLGGMPPKVPQSGPTVTDTRALVQVFRNSSIVILENHGIVAAADNLIDAFSLVDVAEDSAKTTLLGEVVKKGTFEKNTTPEKSKTATLDVFTDEHMSLIQNLINNDNEAVRLGMATDLTVRYAIMQTEDRKVYNMHFEKGMLVKITNDLSDADFINNGKKSVWINIFNGRLDPFAATIQKKLRLEKGHIGDLSRWYAPFYRIFALWKDAPVKELDN